MSHAPALRALGYQQISGAAAATALTIPAGTSRIIITVTAQAVRWRDDGTDPTAAVGYPLAVNVEMVYTSANMSRLKFIEQVAGTVINACYYG